MKSLHFPIQVNEKVLPGTVFVFSFSKYNS